MADNENGTGAPGGNAGGGNGSNSNSSSNNAPGGGQQPVAGTGGAGNQNTGGGANGNGGEQSYSFKENRADWLPRDRFNQVTSRATKAEQEVARLKAELDTRDGRIRALAGVETPDPKVKEADELRSLIYSLVPEIGALKGLTQDQLQEVLAAAKEAKGATAAGWARHRDGVLSSLNSEAAKGMGVDALTPSQAKSMLVAFRASAQDCVEERKMAMRRGERESLQTQQGDNDFVSRYEAGDTKLIQEFVKAYLDDFYTPARRTVEARVQNRNRPLPTGSRVRQIPAQGEQKHDLNSEDGFKAALIAARSGGERA